MLKNCMLRQCRRRPQAAPDNVISLLLQGRGDRPATPVIRQ
jgi:hypothetical protein